MKSRKIYILYVLQCFFIGLLVLVMLGYKMQVERKGFLDNEMFSENVHGLQMSSGELQEMVDFRLPQIQDQPYMLYRYLSYGANECVRGVYGTQDVFGFSKYLASGRFFSKEDHEDAKPVAVLGSRAYSNAVERDGKSIYVYNNTEYEVIGVFAQNDTLLDRAVFLNLTALEETMSQYCGVYYVDAPDKAVVEDVVQRIREDSGGAWTIFDVEHETPGSVQMGKMGFTLFVFSSISALLCLLITTIFLISGQRYSIAVKKLVGMTKREMFIENIRKMGMVCASAFGLICGAMAVFTNVLKVPFFITSDVGIVHYGILGAALLLLGAGNALYATRLTGSVELSTVLKGR